MRLALTHPELVRGLILIDTQAQQEDPSKTPGYKQMIDIWTAQGLPDAIADTIADLNNLTHAASVNAAIERFLQTLQVDPDSNHPGDKS